MNRSSPFYTVILLISFVGISFAHPHPVCPSDENLDFENSVKKAHSHLRQRLNNKSQLNETAGGGSPAALQEIRRCFDARKKIDKKTWMAQRHHFFNALKTLAFAAPGERSPEAGGTERAEIEDISFSLAHDPDVPAAVQKEALFASAALSARYGDKEKLKDLLYEALRRYPQDEAAIGHVFFNAGKVLGQKNGSTDVCDFYGTIAQRIPDSAVSAECRNAVANTYLRNAEYDKAIGEYEAILAMKSVPELWHAYSKDRIGYVHMLKEEYATALSWFQRIINEHAGLEGWTVFSLYEQARLYLKWEQEEKAAELFKEIIARYPESPWSKAAKIKMNTQSISCRNCLRKK